MAMFLKDPDGLVDYRVDWAAACAAGQAIAESVWTVEPAGSDAPVVSGSSISDKVAIMRLSGGARGSTYRIGNRVTLSDGTIDERTLLIRVEDR
jgi:hypothetical protein